MTNPIRNFPREPKAAPDDRSRLSGLPKSGRDRNFDDLVEWLGRPYRDVFPLQQDKPRSHHRLTDPRFRQNRDRKGSVLRVLRPTLPEELTV